MSESVINNGINDPRLNALFEYGVKDLLPESEFETITSLASYILKS